MGEGKGVALASLTNQQLVILTRFVMFGHPPTLTRVSPSPLSPFPSLSPPRLTLPRLAPRLDTRLPFPLVCSPMKQIRPSLPGVFPLLPSGELCSVSLGNGSRFDILCTMTPQGVFVAIVSSGRYGGAYVFAVPPSPGYLAEKLRLLEGDAACVADLVACQLGCAPTSSTYRPVGDYAPSLCGI